MSSSSVRHSSRTTAPPRWSKRTKPSAASSVSASRTDRVLTASSAATLDCTSRVPPGMVPVTIPRCRTIFTRRRAGRGRRGNPPGPGQSITPWATAGGMCGAIRCSVLWREGGGAPQSIAVTSGWDEPWIRGHFCLVKLNGRAPRLHRTIAALNEAGKPVRGHSAVMAKMAAVTAVVLLPDGRPSLVLMAVQAGHIQSARGREVDPQRERTGRGAVRPQVAYPVLRVPGGGDLAAWDPPQRQVCLFHPLEPFPAAAENPPVLFRIDEGGQCLDRLPHRHVEDHPRAAGLVPFEGAHGGRVAVFGLQPPDEARCHVRQGVDRVERRHEAGQLRAVQRCPQPADVDLSEYELHAPILPMAAW